MIRAMNGGALFPSTRHSVIARIREADPQERRDAFGELISGYWQPVYAHLRVTWRLAPEDAQDLTQGFFSEAFEKAWLERFEPEKARFRTFVRVCADRFVMHSRQSASRQKRGGGIQLISLDFGNAERHVVEAASVAASDVDAFFQQEFVRALFERAVGAVRCEYEASGRSVQFTLFERHDLASEEAVSHACLAAEFGLSTTQVNNSLAQTRRRFREHALEALRTLCGSDDEYRREARDLFGVEAR